MAGLLRARNISPPPRLFPVKTVEAGLGFLLVERRSALAHCMRLSRFDNTFLGFVFAIGFLLPAPMSRSQPPSTPSEGPAELKKSAPVLRVKPQVIYRLPRTPSDVAALHAQAKAESYALPIDSSMPTSLQLARSNANAAAASPSPDAHNQVAQADDRKVPRNKVAKTRSAHASHSAKGPGAQHGKKH